VYIIGCWLVVLDVALLIFNHAVLASLPCPALPGPAWPCRQASRMARGDVIRLRHWHDCTSTCWLPLDVAEAHSHSDLINAEWHTLVHLHGDRYTATTWYYIEIEKPSVLLGFCVYIFAFQFYSVSQKKPSPFYIPDYLVRYHSIWPILGRNISPSENLKQTLLCMMQQQALK